MEEAILLVQKENTPFRSPSYVHIQALLAVAPSGLPSHDHIIFQSQDPCQHGFHLFNNV